MTLDLSKEIPFDMWFHISQYLETHTLLILVLLCKYLGKGLKGYESLLASVSSPCESAALSGDLPILKWFHGLGIKLESKIFNYAAEEGHLPILRWASENSLNLTKDICFFAARGEKMNTVEWAVNSGFSVPEDVFSSVGKCTNISILARILDISGFPPRPCDIEIFALHGNITALEYYLPGLDDINGGCWREELEYSVYIERAAIGVASGGHCAVLDCLVKNHAMHLEKRMTRIAAQNEKWEMLEHLVSKHVPLDSGLYVDVIKYGDLDRMRWLKSHGCEKSSGALFYALHVNKEDIVRWLISEDFPPSERFFTEAAERGNLEYLDYCASKGVIEPIKASIHAIKEGHFHVIEWLIASLHPLPHRLAYFAARFGNLELLDWFKAKNVIWDVKENDSIEITKGGHLHVLKWMEENRCTLDYHNIGRVAAFGGHMAVLEWANSKGFAGGCIALDDAIKGNQTEAFLWLLRNGGKLSPRTCNLIAEYGTLEMLKCAREKGMIWSEEFTRIVAERPHSTADFANVTVGRRNIDMIKWALENGCLWGKKTSTAAASAGRFELLKWATENGCKLEKTVSSIIVATGKLSLLKWAIGTGCRWDPLALSYALKVADFEILKWALGQGAALPENWHTMLNRSDQPFMYDWVMNYVVRHPNMIRGKRDLEEREKGENCTKSIRRLHPEELRMVAPFDPSRDHL